MGFTSVGLPVGVTFSFLISSPMVDLGALVLLMSIFGGKIAVAYVMIGLLNINPDAVRLIKERYGINTV